MKPPLGGLGVLNILLLHFINNIFRCSHAQRQYGPCNIFISLAYKWTSINTKKIFAIMRLAPFIQCRPFWIISHATVPASCIIFPGACKP